MEVENEHARRYLSVLDYSLHQQQQQQHEGGEGGRGRGEVLYIIIYN